MASLKMHPRAMTAASICFDRDALWCRGIESLVAVTPRGEREEGRVEGFKKYKCLRRSLVRL